MVARYPLNMMLSRMIGSWFTRKLPIRFSQNQYRHTRGWVILMIAARCASVR
ncbi:Uncharacterised protein [Mycobacteroides abscessus subsp. abscessus]|nr:Uncharacterised protein [Mycobacteroides abscessus subsp. abscessus]